MESGSRIKETYKSCWESGGVEINVRLWLSFVLKETEALFTSKEGNPWARVTLVGGSKTARVCKQNFTGRVTLPPGTTYLCLVTARIVINVQRVWKQVKSCPG